MGESWCCKHLGRHTVSAGLVDAIHWRQLLLRADLWQKESHICVSSEPLTAKTPRASPAFAPRIPSLGS